jgi:phage terminase small subunit
MEEKKYKPPGQKSFKPGKDAKKREQIKSLVKPIRRKAPLTIQQIAFCDALFENGGNVSDAARKAGYKYINNGFTIAADPRAIEYLQQKKIKLKKEHIPSGDVGRLKQMERLNTIIEESMNTKQYQTALKAMELYGKWEGLMAPKVNLNLSSDDIVVSFGGWSTNQKVEIPEAEIVEYEQKKELNQPLVQLDEVENEKAKIELKKIEDKLDD